jgi:hypothetical protein
MAKVRTYLGVAAVVVVAAGLAQTPPGYTLMRDMGLSQAPAAYTQLYFAHPSSLPAILTSSAATVAVPFEIRNTSTAPRGYQWSISITLQPSGKVTGNKATRNKAARQQGGSTRQLGSGSVQVPPGGTVTVAKAVTFSCAPGRVHVEIGLTSPRESITFWAACASSPNPARTS